MIPFIISSITYEHALHRLRLKFVIEEAIKFGKHKQPKRLKK